MVIVKINYNRGVSGDFPGGGTPEVVAGAPHVLTFASGTYTFTTAGTEVYGFICSVSVPKYGPTMAPANFYVEFGTLLCLGSSRSKIKTFGLCAGGL